MDKLQQMKASGHGLCLEAIKLEDDPRIRLELLRTYLMSRSDAHPKQIRRAKRLIAQIKEK